MTIEALKAANPQIKNIDKIKIGDKLNIPQPRPGRGRLRTALTAAPAPVSACRARG